MKDAVLCWSPVWNPAAVGIGLEHVLVSAGEADGCLLAIDEDGTPFRLQYRLAWDEQWRLRRAELRVHSGDATRTLVLETDGRRWSDDTGRALDALEGCKDIDIWPTPFTNTFPILREPLAIGERREFRMAWIAAPALTVEPIPQAYTRLAERLYLFENLDGSGFRAELPVDEQGFVLDYPNLFRRVGPRA